MKADRKKKKNQLDQRIKYSTVIKENNLIKKKKYLLLYKDT